MPFSLKSFRPFVTMETSFFSKRNYEHYREDRFTCYKPYETVLNPIYNTDYNKQIARVNTRTRRRTRKEYETCIASVGESGSVLQADYSTDLCFTHFQLAI